jgi:2-keto-4-pentenoate hydratase
VPFPAWFGDNMGNHTYAIGASVPFASVAGRLDSLRCTVTVDGAVSHDAPGHPLGDPLKPLVACVNAQVDRFGGFRAGQLVTLGSINKPVLVTGPATLTGALDGIGTVTVVLTA